MENTGGGIGKRSEMRDTGDFASAFSAMKRERAGGSHHAKSPLLKAAKQIGVTIPQWTLMKATKVIQ
jgi:hypothetical protein